MSALNSTQVNSLGLRIVEHQLAYSTAQIERGVFYGAISSDSGHQISQDGQTSAPGTDEPVTVLAIEGELHPLAEEGAPEGAVPLTEESGLFRIAGLADTTE